MAEGSEEGLTERTLFYATDINQSVLEQARSGVFPLDKMREYTQNYIKAGGTRSFSEYYLAKYDGALNAITNEVAKYEDKPGDAQKSMDDLQKNLDKPIADAKKNQ